LEGSFLLSLRSRIPTEQCFHQQLIVESMEGRRCSAATTSPQMPSQVKFKVTFLFRVHADLPALAARRLDQNHHVLLIFPSVVIFLIGLFFLLSSWSNGYRRHRFPLGLGRPAEPGSHAASTAMLGAKGDLGSRHLIMPCDHTIVRSCLIWVATCSSEAFV
jgi:hypothetical protein